ncbi:hypothetical protein [Paracoccus sp. AK26]|uniref:hypothetical protein n=1 Tax=Paracoccus sp. AK26 TaxID=2589076 RepID=UPI00142805F9|nr:hypothetical protein [Paracoccus sp. AK26]QIR84488.1 hypothetical protein FIU66_04255 [Paracoccus sp. AK26]
MTQGFRFCSCGTRLDYHPKKGGGRPPKYCPPCKIAHDKQTDAENVRIAAEILEHITKRFKEKFSVVGTPHAQMFLATLFEEIRHDPEAVSVHFRRALTNPSKKEKKTSHTLASYLGAFSRVHRGMWLSQIFIKKEKTRIKHKTMNEAERIARAKSDVGDDFLHYSPMAYLLEGYELPRMKSKKTAKADGKPQVQETVATAEVIPFPEPSKPLSLTEAILDHVRNGYSKALSSLSGISRKDIEWIHFGC